MTNLHNAISEEKLTEAYRLLLEMRDNCAKHADDPYDDPKREAKREALNIAITAMGRSVPPRWISVKENVKPKLRQDCLCICSYSDAKNHEWDYMMVLRWMGEGDNGYVNRPHFQHEGMEGMIVTHWMPLPLPPSSPDGESTYLGDGGSGTH